ncbi:MAG: ComEC/Rec2 family competence protein [Clostridiales bacterium]|nr:ComEC/Rec2 family competence protein [Clostridiales bacterium]
MCFKTAGIVVGAVYLTALAALAVVFIIRFVKSKAKLRMAVTFGLSLVLSLLAFCFGAAYVNSRAESMKNGGYHYVVGRVCAVDIRNGRYRIDLEDLVFDGKEHDGILRITVRASDNNVAETVQCGDGLSFNAKVSCKQLVSDGKVDGTSYRTDIIYTATVSSDEIKVIFGEPSPIESFLSGLRELLTKNMGDKYGNIAFSMLTGDKHALGYDVTDYYSAAGLGHIMAVSGLHIGFLVVLLNIILARVGRKTRFGIIAAFLVVYVVIADFSPSVVRAAIMCVIAMFSVFVGGRRDILSAVLCAYSFILAFKPLYLFEVGFVLSFGAIFGIALFARTFARGMENHGIHRKIGNAVGASASVQIGIVPAETYFFGKIQTLALIVNVILIPYIAVVFVSIVIFSIIGAIPGIGAVLVVPKYLLVPIDYIAQGIAAVPYSTFYVNTTAAAFLCYPVMFVASEYFMMNRGKLAVILASIAVCFAFLCINTGKPSAKYYAETGKTIVAAAYDVEILPNNPLKNIRLEM